jgi:hypothetical protein
MALAWSTGGRAHSLGTARKSALTGLKPRIGLVYDVDAAFAPDNLVVPVPGT